MIDYEVSPRHPPRATTPRQRWLLVLGLGLAGWVVLYAAVYGLTSLLIDGLRVAYEPNDNVCRSLTDQTEERIRGPLLAVTAVATIWAVAGGLLTTLAGAQAIGDRTLRTTWAATVGIVAGVLPLWVLVAVLVHDGLVAWAVFLLLVAVVGGGSLLVGAIVGICVWATKSRHSQIRAPALGPLAWLISLAVFILGVALGIAGLFAGPLDPVVEIPVC